MAKEKGRIPPKGDQFYGWVTVSSKGQIAIPTEVRNTLNIKSGDRLLIIIRKDKDGMNLIKSEALEGLFEKLSR